MTKPIKSTESLIKSYRKRLNKTIQRSELLRRNPRFHEELNGFTDRVGIDFFKVKDVEQFELDEERENNILIELDYPKEDFTDTSQRGAGKPIKTDRYWKGLVNLDCPLYNPPKSIRERLFNKTRILTSYKGRWDDLCDRWHIESEWDGNIDSLDRFARQNIEIYSDWEHNIQKRTILISINEWTTLEDIKSKWDEIEKLQNEYWGKKERRSNFARDLIWFDLNVKHKMPPSEIAATWDKHHPQDIDLLTIRRFRKDIKPDHLGGKIWEDADLLIEIQRGQLKPRYNKAFLEERHYYLTGKIKKGSKYVSTPKPFLDVVKKAIERMKQQIASSSLPPLPEERSFMGFPPQRIS